MSNSFEKSNTKRILSSAAILALGASILGSSSSEAAPKPKPNPVVAKIELGNPNYNQAEVLRAIALKELQDRAKANAKLIAKQENEAAKANVKAAPHTKVLNGVVSLKINDGKILGADNKSNYLPAYANPYFLAPNGSAYLPDDQGKFLNGAWIGILSNDKYGKIVITPIKYDSNTMRFDENTQIGKGALIDVGVSITKGEGMLGNAKLDVLTPLAFDLNGSGPDSVLFNDNQTFVSPGRVLSNK